ncbi:hypothetical protein, partial [Actinomyces dentalis]|uniref:hypothetical protein n=1 Tax=Actinomyces dentalis TaxID=272548 RepID=UPI0028E38F36
GPEDPGAAFARDLGAVMVTFLTASRPACSGGGTDEYAAIIVHRGGAGPVGHGRDRVRAARAGRAGAAVREIAG